MPDNKTSRKVISSELKDIKSYSILWIISIYSGLQEWILYILGFMTFYIVVFSEKDFRLMLWLYNNSKKSQNLSNIVCYNSKQGLITLQVLQII